MATSLRTRRTRLARGASTVEVAVSMLLLIPTALYAIYAGEAFMAATRAQEAEISATWDITGYLLHDFDNGFDYESGPDGDPSLYVDVSGRVARQVKRELGTMDSFEYSEGTGGNRYVVSAQHVRSLSCLPMDARPIENGALLTFQSTFYQTREYLHRGGYVRCNAQVSFFPQFMPRYMREGYNSKVDLLSRTLDEGFTVCGSGNTFQGCEGAYRPGIIVLTNDWGLEDGIENPLGTQENGKYFRVGQKVYNVKYWGDEDDKAGGIGHEQVTEAMKFMLDDEEFGDRADTSTFKFGFYNPMSQRHRYPGNRHQGRDDAHLSPYDDGEGELTSTRNVYLNHRSRHNYLGHPDPHFNQP
jgi:hypothetical protein